jgi:hypothetical protein
MRKTKPHFGSLPLLFWLPSWKNFTVKKHFPNQERVKPTHSHSLSLSFCGFSSFC